MSVNMFRTDTIPLLSMFLNHHCALAARWRRTIDIECDGRGRMRGGGCGEALETEVADVGVLGPRLDAHPSNNSITSLAIYTHIRNHGRPIRQCAVRPRPLSCCQNQFLITNTTAISFDA